MEISDEIINELTKNCKTQDGFNALFRALKKRGLEAALAGELTDHIGYEKHERAETRKPNSRNGFSKKTMVTSQSNLDINISHDREGSYEPQIIERYQTRFDGIDDWRMHYNSIRPHSSLNYQTPNEFKLSLGDNITIGANFFM